MKERPPWLSKKKFEALLLDQQGLSPKEIAAKLGLTRTWAKNIVGVAKHLVWKHTSAQSPYPWKGLSFRAANVLATLSGNGVDADMPRNRDEKAITRAAIRDGDLGLRTRNCGRQTFEEICAWCDYASHFPKPTKGTCPHCGKPLTTK